VRWLLLLVIASCATGASHPRPVSGGIAGLARDHDSGDPVAKAEIKIACPNASRTTLSGDNGLYDVEKLPAGKCTLTATFAGQPVEVTNIEVTAGQITLVDISFTLGRPEPIRVDFGNSRASQIDHYKPSNASPQTSVIEGTVNDLATKRRVAGAVVTAVPGEDVTKTQQTVSDDHGRFRFEVHPDTYSVSAYYSVGGRGQIEVRRSNIAVEGAEAVHVPLWIEMNR
jgi:hypothetical protein